MKKILLLTLLMLPLQVFASTGSVSEAIMTQLFTTIHMSIFVFFPIANVLSEEGELKSLFIKLFVIRAIILLVFDLFIPEVMTAIDFFAIFIGAFIAVPICSVITKKSPFKLKTKPVQNPVNVIKKCQNCGATLNADNNFCASCGTKIEEVLIQSVKPQYDSIFDLNENAMVEEFIDRELKKANIDRNTKLIPREVLKKKKILNVIFSILLFIYISLIFFHLTMVIYIIGAIILFIFFKVSRKYNLMVYLKKQLKSRPSEKVSNIVMNTKSQLVENNTKYITLSGMFLALIIPLIIFMNPRVFYEKMDNGYAVRFYTFGLTNFKTVTIPSTYKGENVVALRGNTFSNMPFLEEVTLPDTITEIRGRAFKNDKKLTKINIPKNLEYLGGGAFYNCTSLKTIELPDTLTYMGGETFYNATSLESIKLSNNLTEIRGNTFEECRSLESITLPDSVTRIGGHAFYGNTSLKTVTLTENSKLKEIGSSAFRMCLNLDEITLPKETSVNSRAFKESPTVVKRFGENTLTNASNNKYKYDTYRYIKLNQEITITPYQSDSKSSSFSIELVNVLEQGNSNSFNLIYKDTDGTVNFMLTKDAPYQEINKNVAVEISSSYIFNRTDSVSLNVYYN